MTDTANNLQDVLRWLHAHADTRWLLRGQPNSEHGLQPSIDRKPRDSLTRAQKLELERRSIALFQTTARHFADPAESGALHNDVVALMVMRHYGVPTRLLDWTSSPWVAAYFAASEDDSKSGAIWAFDRPRYQEKAKVQWKKWPQTTTDGSGTPELFDSRLTMFDLNEPPDWFICCFYEPGFHRQSAQRGAYSMTARFGIDHGDAIARLLDDALECTKLVFPGELKSNLRRELRDRYEVWRGSLFPDSAGAAETAGTVFEGTT